MPDIAPEVVARWLHATPLPGIDLDLTQVALSDLFERSGVVPGSALYVKWGALGDIDRFESGDLCAYFYEVWYQVWKSGGGWTGLDLLSSNQGTEIPDFRHIMGSLVRVQTKGQMTIPRRVRSAVGLADGDVVEVKAVGNKIVITPQIVIDRSKFPSVDEYTPAQRRIIDARLKKSDEDIKHGRVYGPFETHKEFMAALRRDGAKKKP